MIDFKKALQINDFEIIAQLADTIWRAHYIPMVGKSQIDYMLEKFQSATAIEHQIHEGYTYYLILFENKPVGYLSIKKEETLLFLSKIYILEAYRGKRIGFETIKFVEMKARIVKLQGVRLTVNVNNTASIVFYEKMGFYNNGPLVTNIGKGFIMDDYEMIKLI